MSLARVRSSMVALDEAVRGQSSELGTSVARKSVVGSKTETLCQTVPLAVLMLATWSCSAGRDPLAAGQAERSPSPTIVTRAIEGGTGASEAPAEAAPPRPAVVPFAMPASLEPLCKSEASHWRANGEPMPTEILRVEPELIAAGIFGSLALSDDRVFAISSFRNNNVVPDVAEILSFDLTSLERQVVFSQLDGFQDPSALLVHEDTLYIQDWATGDLFQVPLDAPALNLLATDVARGLGLSRWEASVFLSDYRGGRVFRVGESTASNAALAGGPLDLQAVVVEELSEVPYPSGVAAWQGHAAWGTDSNNGNANNRLVIRDLIAHTDLSIDVAGSIPGLDVNTTELAWATYALRGSELSRMPLRQSGSPVADEIDTLLFCGQPSSAVLHGTLAVYGGPGLMLWEREATVLQVLDVGFVRDLAIDERHIYFVTWDGLYRIARPQSA
jgi:hypothetical protein